MSLLLFISGYAENVFKESDEVIMAHCAEHGTNIPRKYEQIIILLSLKSKTSPFTFNMYQELTMLDVCTSI